MVAVLTFWPAYVISTDAARAELVARFHTARDAELRLRCQTVLLAGALTRCLCGPREERVP